MAVGVPADTPPFSGLGARRTCNCEAYRLNCLTGGEWLRNQRGIWRFVYDKKRDLRGGADHPAVWPVALPRRLIRLFTHEGQLVLDPFSGTGTTLLAARDTGRNAVGIDISAEYTNIAERRLKPTLLPTPRQIPVCDTAANVHRWIPPGSVSLVVTSPPYTNILNRERRNVSRRNRRDSRYGTDGRYTDLPGDLGNMPLGRYLTTLGDIFENILGLLRPKGHCVINIADIWVDDRRILLHQMVTDELRDRGYELRNVIIWDRTNIVNGMGIFGYPSNYITMSTTFEYLLDFWRPA